MKKLIRGLEWFRTLDPNMSINSILVFLYAMQKEAYPTQRDIEKKLGASNAAASRNVSYWLEYKKGMTAGQGLLQQTPDIMDRRAQVLNLTPKGRAFTKQLELILED